MTTEQNFDSKTETINSDDVVNILPNHKNYEILEISTYGNRIPKMEVTLKAALYTKEDVQQWIQILQEKTHCTYSIRSTEKPTGKLVTFKQRLNCHHNTRSPEITGHTKNTNCPSALNITIRAINKKFRGKKENAVDPNMPCVIVFVFNHNHDTMTADVLRFRRVSEETKEKLMSLFKEGHSPSTALECLRIEIQTNYENYDQILADRKLCPDYYYCYSLFMNEFQKCFGPANYDYTKDDILLNKIDNYNNAMGGEYMKMVINLSHFIIVICPPLFRRVHENISEAGELVFMDSRGSVNQDGNKVFILFTISRCGGLPLGVIVTSSESTENLRLGLEILNNLIGDNRFHGNIEGPHFFILNDSEAEVKAVKSVYTSTNVFLSIFSVLQSVHRWLVASENDEIIKFFECFQKILYSKSHLECEKNYMEAVKSAEDFSSYAEYLQSYWQRRKMWALCYRNNVVETNNYSETTMRLLKEKIFKRVKAFNIVQLVDFIVSKFVDYYRIRLLDAAHDQVLKNKFIKPTKSPPINLTCRLQKFTDYAYLVPDETNEDLHYIVYPEALICTCSKGISGNVCKHIDWVFLSVFPKIYEEKIDCIATRSIYYKIATGNDVPDEWLTRMKRKLSVDISIVQVESEIAENNEIVCAEEEVLYVDETFDNKNVVFVDHMYDDRNEEYLEACQKKIEELAECFAAFANSSPSAVLPALTAMAEKTKVLKTTSSFVTSCYTFASDSHHKDFSNGPRKKTKQKSTSALLNISNNAKKIKLFSNIVLE